jgi:membrane protein YdbS with pleckstrin-like domain
MRRPRALGDLQPEERLLLLARRHPLMLLRWAAPALTASVALAAAGRALQAAGLDAALPVVNALLAAALAWAGWTWADWRADLLALTDRRVMWIERTPLVRERRWEAQLGGVQNVAAVARGPLPYIFGCDDLVLDTASRGAQRVEGLRRAQETATAVLDAQAYAARRSHRLGRLRADMGLRPAGDPQAEAQPELLVWRKHPWLLLRDMWGPVLLLGAGAWAGGLQRFPALPAVAATLALLWAAWLWDDWRNDETVVTAERVVQTSRRPLTLHQESWQASLDKVRDISCTVPHPLAQLLGYGMVTVETDGDSEGFRLEGVPRPREVSAELNRRLTLRRTRGRQDLIREVEATVRAVLRERGL